MVLPLSVDSNSAMNVHAARVRVLGIPASINVRLDKVSRLEKSQLGNPYHNDS